MTREEAVKIALAGVALGITAGLVVWFLERFEVNRAVAELRNHLDNMSDEYRAWLDQRPQRGQP